MHLAKNFTADHAGIKAAPSPYDTEMTDALPKTLFLDLSRSPRLSFGMFEKLSQRLSGGDVLPPLHPNAFAV